MTTVNTVSPLMLVGPATDANLVLSGDEIRLVGHLRAMSKGSAKMIRDLARECARPETIRVPTLVRPPDMKR